MDITKVTNKLEKDGAVAVLYSPGFGAGWSTWNPEVPEIVFDPGIVSLVEQQQWDELATYVRLKYPDIYAGGMKELKVAWVGKGSLFRITEYDGAESIEFKDNDDWITA